MNQTIEDLYKILISVESVANLKNLGSSSIVFHDHNTRIIHREDDEIGQEDHLLSKNLLRRKGITAFGSSMLLVISGEYEDILFVRVSA
jgi:hypothetical protein